MPNYWFSIPDDIPKEIQEIIREDVQEAAKNRVTTFRRILKNIKK